MPGGRHDASQALGPLARRGRAVPHPKGRQLDPRALAEVRSLLGDRPRRRDLLIEHLHHATAEAVAAAVAGGRTGPTLPESTTDFEAYSRGGGYRLLRDCLNGQYARDDLVAALADSGLRGLGGAGFPAGQKWKLVRQ